MKTTDTAKSIRLNCFSPPVMLATFAIEIILAVYTVSRYKLNVLTRLVVVCLVALATFQLCEYHVCGGLGIRAEEWSRFGYVAITLLPPLGLHILHILAGKPRRRLVATAYVTMATAVVYFLLNRTAFRSYQCTGNYDIFQIGARSAMLYGIYYYGWLFGAMGLGITWANELNLAGKVQIKRLQSVRALVMGYLVFLLPTALANTINPHTRRGIPSIMCGFAVLFAFILTFYIMPLLGQKKHS